jgi:hypothetical protein
LISKDVERVLLSMEKNLFQFGKSPIYLPQFRRKNTLSMNSTAQMWKRMKQCSPTPLLDLDLDRTSLSSTAHSSVLKKKKKNKQKSSALRPPRCPRDAGESRERRRRRRRLRRVLVQDGGADPRE